MYAGEKLTIALGLGGLLTDDPQYQIPLSNLISARSVTLQNGVAEKDFGTRRLNANPYSTPTISSPLPAGIVALYDWWPDEVTQRTIAVCKDGKVYRFTDDYTYSEVTAATGAPTTLTVNSQTHILPCGAESSLRARKLMIFTGNDPVQVISGDGTTRRNLTLPAADWTTNSYPSFGFISRGKVFALGNKNDPHRVYSSKSTDHEDFADTGNFQSAVYPGEHERLVSGWVWKGRQFVSKFPGGMYYLNDESADQTEWYYTKLSDAFGAASAHSVCPALDDMLVANSTGSITSMSAAFQLANVELADVLNALRIENYIRDTMSQVGTPDRWALYYESKKQVYFSYRSSGGTVNDRMLVLDYSRKTPHATFSEKDQANCLAMRKDYQGVKRPMYGSDDGFIYLMDQPDRNVHTSGYYGDVQTPFENQIKNTYGNLSQDTRNKLFDFVELTFEPTGKWNLSCDVYIDSRFIETIQFPIWYDQVLGDGASPAPTTDFILDSSKLQGRVPRSVRKRLHGMGRNISFKLYNSGTGQNFKAQSITVYYRPSGEAQKGNR